MTIRHHDEQFWRDMLDQAEANRDNPRFKVSGHRGPGEDPSKQSTAETPIEHIRRKIETARAEKAANSQSDPSASEIVTEVIGRNPPTADRAQRAIDNANRALSGDELTGPEIVREALGL